MRDRSFLGGCQKKPVELKLDNALLQDKSCFTPTTDQMKESRRPTNTSGFRFIQCPLFLPILLLVLLQVQACYWEEGGTFQEVNKMEKYYPPFLYSLQYTNFYWDSNLELRILIRNNNLSTNSALGVGGLVFVYKGSVSWRNSF